MTSTLCAECPKCQAIAAILGIPLPASTPPAPTPQNDTARPMMKQQINAHYGISAATGDRHDKEDPPRPHYYVGESRRYILQDVDDWYRQRSQQKTNASSSGATTGPVVRLTRQRRTA